MTQSVKIIVLILSLSLVACNAYKGINTAALEVGMTKTTVQAIVQKPMESISAEIDEKGIKKEVFQVQKRIVRGGVARQQRYYIYFADNELVKYELADEKFSF